MSDVFVSYRHDDSGSAGRIADRLAEAHEIDVFFDDDSIKHGDEFTEVLRDGLVACRILLAIIGPAWVLPANHARLSAPNDWVRRELETALERGIRIVPILLDKTLMPTEESLPESIRRLARLDYFPLSSDGFKQHVKTLAGELRHWLEGERNPTAVPTHLPFLCDRFAQEDGLIEKFSEDQGFRVAPVVIVHGHKWEEHDGFLDRLRSLHSLDDILGVSADIGVQITPLQWSAQAAAGGRVAKSLSHAIKRSLIGKLTLPDPEIRAYLLALRQPLVLTIQITADEAAAFGPSLLPELVAAWRALLAVEGAPALPFATVLWINLSYDDANTTLAFDELLGASRPVVAVLQQLSPIGRADAEGWVKLPQVQSFAQPYATRVSDLFDDPQRCVPGTRSMYMRRFVELVREMLSGNA